MPHSIYDFSTMLERAPMYIVGFGYLFLTLVVEFPIVYYDVKKDVKNKQGLIKGIIISNIITTIFTAVVEHILCRGHW
jgi:hypothetical protein